MSTPTSAIAWALPLVLLAIPLILLLIPLPPHSIPGKIAHLLRTLPSHDLDLPYTPIERFSSTWMVILGLSILVLKQITGFGGKLGKVSHEGTLLLPELRISAPVRVSQKEVEAFRAAVSSDGAQQSAPVKIGKKTVGLNDSTPLLLLTALTAPLLPSLLLLLPNPIRPLGSVNVRNTIILHRTELLSSLQLPPGSGADANTDPGVELVAEAKMGGPAPEMLGRRVKRGVEYDTVITVRQRQRRRRPQSSLEPSSIGPDDDHVQDVDAPGELLFTFTFTALAMIRFPSRTPYHASPTAPATAVNTAELPISEPVWTPDPLPLSLRTRTSVPWARISKDFNPIHISPLLARLFGYRGCIAHGNAVLAMVVERAVAAAAANSSSASDPDDAAEAITGRNDLGRLWTPEPASDHAARPIWLSVAFRRPVVLPSSPLLRWSDGRIEVVAPENSTKGGRAGTRGASDAIKDKQGEGFSDGVKVLVEIRSGEGDIVPES